MIADREFIKGFFSRELLRALSESVDEHEALVDRLVGVASVELPFGNGSEFVTCFSA